MVMFGGIDCYKCGKIKPLEEMRSTDIWEESGKSGGSWSFKGWGSIGSMIFSDKKFKRKGGAVFYNAGRKYYRKRKVYICDACYEAEMKKNKGMSVIWVIISFLLSMAMVLSAYFYL